MCSAADKEGRKMTLVLEELDNETRIHMLREFEAELASGNPYRSPVLSERGRAAWPGMFKGAIEQGNDETLRIALTADMSYLNSHEEYSKGVRKVNFAQASERLAIGEFNTFYVRGLSSKLLEEGVSEVEVYRAATPRWEPGECVTHEGRTVAVQDVYDGHRATYWPVPDAGAFAIPFRPGCHHSIRRILN